MPTLSDRTYMTRAARRLVNAMKAITSGPTYPPGHYYSVQTSRSDIQRAIGWAKDVSPALELLNAEEIESFARGIMSQPIAERSTTARYSDNQMFTAADAEILRRMIAHIRPARIVEIGSGFSTVAMLDAIDEFSLDSIITCIEPNADRLRSLLRPGDGISLIEQPVQNVGVRDLTEQLSAGDILFIDSTHVAKAGSDVLWEVLRLLPKLKSEVWVHFHDIFWPMEYPEEWLADRRDWNEVYFLHAYLLENPNWRIKMFSDYIWREASHLVRMMDPSLMGARPGSLWMQRT